MTSLTKIPAPHSASRYPEAADAHAAGQQRKAGALLPSSSIRRQARAFEAVLLNTMLGQMFAGMEESEAIGNNGAGAGTWRSLLIEQYANSIAESGGIGIAAAVERQLVNIQEGNVT